MLHTSAKAFCDSARRFLDSSASAAQETVTCLTEAGGTRSVSLDTFSSKLFDCYVLPLRHAGGDVCLCSLLIEPVKKLRCCVTTRIHQSFQECFIRLVELESKLTFEVR
ncbi:hypothetical protein, unknown function [Leishmania tarentolae]|uniref:Uncharacterized protein n=1 Tax=Leishmania tarentolae TaxID=5689 RepID=A0A640KLM5_LEITA|nr:hypothetical protein, unknown function [Leishmania tarentolae]